MRQLTSIVMHEDGLDLNGVWVPNGDIERFEIHARANDAFHLVEGTRVEGFTIHTRGEPEGEEWVCEFRRGKLPFARLYCYYLYHHAALLVGSQIPNAIDDEKLVRLLSRYQPGRPGNLALWLVCTALALGLALLLLGGSGSGVAVAILAVVAIGAVGIHRLILGVLRRGYAEYSSQRAQEITGTVGPAFLRERISDSAALVDWARRAEFGQRAVETAAFEVVRDASGRAAAMVALRARDT